MPQYFGRAEEMARLRAGRRARVEAIVRVGSVDPVPEDAEVLILGLDSERAAAVEEFVRRRDLDRLVLQQAEGISAGADLLRTRMVHEPLSTPRHEVKPLNPEAEEIIARPPAAE